MATEVFFPRGSIHKHVIHCDFRSSFRCVLPLETTQPRIQHTHHGGGREEGVGIALVTRERRCVSSAVNGIEDIMSIPPWDFAVNAATQTLPETVVATAAPLAAGAARAVVARAQTTSVVSRWVVQARAAQATIAARTSGPIAMLRRTMQEAQTREVRFTVASVARSLAVCILILVIWWLRRRWRRRYSSDRVSEASSSQGGRALTADAAPGTDTHKGDDDAAPFVTTRWNRERTAIGTLTPRAAATGGGRATTLFGDVTERFASVFSHFVAEEAQAATTTESDPRDGSNPTRQPSSLSFAGSSPVPTRAASQIRDRSESQK